MPSITSRAGRPALVIGAAVTGSARLLHQFGGNIEVRRHALHVVVIFQLFGELLNLLDVFGIDIHGVLR
jgi:hypothetical protein